MRQYREFLWNHELDKPLLYQPIEHPYFQDWQVAQPCVERWRMMDAPEGHVVDAGCHTGWFCRRFAELGGTVTGIDKSEKHIEIAREVTEWMGLTGIEYIVGDVRTTSFPQADVALCLSLAMYLFDDGAAEGWDFFNRVSKAANRMYFDFGGRYAENLPFNEDTIIDEMLERTAYNDGVMLGRTRFENRPFYLFSK